MIDFDVIELETDFFNCNDKRSTEECFHFENEESSRFDNETSVADIFDSAKRIFVYTKVIVRGKIFKALLDSGATRSFCNLEVANLLKSWGFSSKKNVMKIKSPLGLKTCSSEIFAMPVSMHGVTAQISAKVLPESDTPLILGTDSLHLFGVLLNFNELNYCLASNPTKTYSFDEIKYEDLENDAVNELKNLCQLDD